MLQTCCNADSAVADIVKMSFAFFNAFGRFSTQFKLFKALRFCLFRARTSGWKCCTI